MRAKLVQERTLLTLGQGIFCFTSKSYATVDLAFSNDKKEEMKIHLFGIPKDAFDSKTIDWLNGYGVWKE